MSGESAQRGNVLLESGRRFGSEPGAFARLLAPGFHKLLDRIDQGLETGSICGRLPDGTTRTLGGRKPGFEAEVQIRDWRASFDTAEAKGRLPDGFDRRFCDLWRFYLMYCEGGFRGGAITVSQVTLVKTARGQILGR